MTKHIELIVGLANPGQQYEQTRHNAGAWYLNALARSQGVTLSEERKFFGYTGQFNHAGRTIRLLIPTTFMNRSGQATAALANFYRIAPEQILVAHDELDLPPGVTRLKVGGGHGGHNGLRDMISQHGNQKNFARLRVGIGHPGSSDLVTPHVLGKPSAHDRELIERSIDEALRYTNDILDGNLNRAMTELNSFRA
ncbi:MAG TPA: aminoacyl-tRNA hydrolase [Alcanivoracaceae bacterium]|nr:aminoacyl-tRNA hydrolase [Alcanivoracaceae bacterium]